MTARKSRVHSRRGASHAQYAMQLFRLCSAQPEAHKSPRVLSVDEPLHLRGSMHQRTKQARDQKQRSNNGTHTITRFVLQRQFLRSRPFSKHHHTIVVQHRALRHVEQDLGRRRAAIALTLAVVASLRPIKFALVPEQAKQLSGQLVLQESSEHRACSARE